MIESIRVQGLRSIVDSGYIEIKPITIVLGCNSTGKSSFIRTFPLIKQSAEVSTKGPLLWYGKYVDFGTYKEAKSSFVPENEIGFSFKAILESPDDEYFLPTKSNDNRFECYATQYVTSAKSVGSDSPTISTISKKIELEFLGNKVEVELNLNRNEEFYDVVSAILNSEAIYSDLPSTQKIIAKVGKFFPQINRTVEKKFKIGGEDLKRNFITSIDGLVKSRIFRYLLSDFLSGNTGENKLESFVNSWNLATFDDFYDFILNQKEFNIKKFTNKKTGKKESAYKLYILFISLHIPRILKSISEEVNSLSNSIQYIKPIRAHAERYYRTQDLAINEIDSAGENVAMYLNSLSRTKKDQWNRWLFERFSFKIVANSGAGHVSMELFREGESKGTNLADLGFGFSQILPVLLQLWIAETKSSGFLTHHFKLNEQSPLIVMEQPELHLHPAYQKKIADIFASTIAVNQREPIRLVIETHSQTIVNRLGELVSSRSLNKDDVSILIVEKDETGTSIRSTAFDDQGFVKDWPIGFFD